MRRISAASTRRASGFGHVVEQRRKESTLPADWLAALSAAIEPFLQADSNSQAMRESLLQCVENLQRKDQQVHEVAIEAMRSKAQWQQQEQEKKLSSLRRAGNVEGDQLSAKMQASQQAVARLQSQFDEYRLKAEQRISTLEANEKKLKWKISQLDGGIAVAELEREQYIANMGERAIRRMKSAELYSAFACWQELYVEHRRMRSVAGRFLNMAVSRAWGAWQDMIEEMARQRRMLAAAAARLARPALAASLAHWKQDWEYARQIAAQGGLLGRIAALEEALLKAQQEIKSRVEEEAAAAQAAERQRYIEQLAGRAVRRMLSQQLARGFEGWCDYWEAAASARRILASAVGRLARPALAASLAHWKQDWEAKNESSLKARVAALEEEVHELRQDNMQIQEAVAEARRERIEQMGSRAVRRMLSQQLARGFEAWTEMWEEQVRKKRMMGSFVGRLMNQHLARGWGAWLEYWEEQASTRRMIAAAVSRLRAPSLSASFQHWLQDWMTAKPKELSADQLRAQLAVAHQAAQSAASAARREAERRKEEIKELKHQRDALQVNASQTLNFEMSMKQTALGKLEETEKQLSLERTRAEKAELTAQRLEAKLNSRDAPLSVREKAELVAAMNARMEELAKAFAKQRTLSTTPRLAHGTRSTPQLVPARDKVHETLLELSLTPSHQATRAWKQHIIVSDEIKVLLHR